mgnify:CR=1 FL=1
MEEFKRWADQQLQSLLQFDSLAGVVDSLVSFRQEDELRAYLRDFLGEGPSQTEFVNEFLERRKAIRHLLDMPSVDGGGLKVLRKPKSDLEDYYGGVKETGGKGHRRSPARSQRSGGSSAPTSSQATDGSIGHAEEPGSKWAGGKGGSTAKKTTIDLSKMDFNMLLPGRRECGCQATKHDVLINCLHCGRVACKQEGPGPCFFCGNLVAMSQEDVQKRLDKNPKLKAALEHRDRLLEFDRTSTRRTKVIDDQAEYYHVEEGNVWLSEEEKAVRKEIARRVKEEEENMKNRISFDFAGRKIIRAMDDPDEVEKYWLGESSTSKDWGAVLEAEEDERRRQLEDRPDIHPAATSSSHQNRIFGGHQEEEGGEATKGRGGGIQVLGPPQSSHGSTRETTACVGRKCSGGCINLTWSRFPARWGF